jgi:hypothetical protein
MGTGAESYWHGGSMDFLLGWSGAAGWERVALLREG